MEKNNIVLIGFMGSGKTTVGKILAEKINFHFVDTDEAIEKDQGMTIPDIFDKFGEEYFRALERKIIRSLLNKSCMVISTGGGAVTDKSLFEHMMSSARVVHLETSIDTVWERIKDCTDRPMLYCENPRNRMEELYNKRLPIYRKAHYSIKTDNKKPMDVVLEIMLKLSID